MTTALASSTTSPAVRLRPAPAFEPPYDDEVGRPWPDDPARVGPYDVELPLDWGGAARHSNGRATRRRRTGARPAGRPGPAGWRAVPEDLVFSIRRFVNLYVEVLNRRRPLAHLRGHTSAPAFNAIRLSLARRRSWWPVPVRSRPYARPRRGLPDDDRSAAAVPAPPARIRVQRLRTCQPAPGVAEVAVVLRRGAEVRALALRLEREGRTWTVTTLDFVA